MLKIEFLEFASDQFFRDGDMSVANTDAFLC